MEAPGLWNGLRIVVSEHLTETVPYPRSPSRAKRRAARGFPQCVRTIPSTTAYMIGKDTLVVHPARYAALLASIRSTP